MSTTSENPVGSSSIADDSQVEGQYLFDLETIQVQIGASDNQGPAESRTEDDQLVYPHFRPAIKATSTETLSLELSETSLVGRKVVYTETGTLALEDVGNSYKFPNLSTEAESLSGGLLTPIAQNTVSSLQYDGGTDYFPSILPLTIRGETIDIKSVGRDTTVSLEVDVIWNDGEGTVRSDDGKTVYPYFRPTIEAEFIETASLEIALTPIEGYLFDQWYEAKEDTGGLLGPISMNSITELQFDGGTDYFPSIIPLTWQADESTIVKLNSIDSSLLDINVTDNDDGSAGILRQDGKFEYPWFRPALELEDETITFKSLAAFSESYKFAATLGDDEESFTPVGVISNTSITTLGRMASLDDPRDIQSYAQLKISAVGRADQGKQYIIPEEPAPLEINATDEFSFVYSNIESSALETIANAEFENVFNITDSATFVKLSVIDEDIIYNVVDTSSLELDAEVDIENIYSFTDITSLGVLSAVDVEVAYSFTNAPFNTFRATDQTEVILNTVDTSSLELDAQVNIGHIYLIPPDIISLGVLSAVDVEVTYSVTNAPFNTFRATDQTEVIYNDSTPAILELDAEVGIANIYLIPPDIVSLGVLSAVDVEVTYSVTTVPFNTFRATDQLEVIYNDLTPAILELNDQNAQEVTIGRESDVGFDINANSAAFSYTFLKQINEKPKTNLQIQVDGDGEYIAYEPPLIISQVDSIAGFTINAFVDETTPVGSAFTQINTLLVDDTVRFSFNVEDDTNHIIDLPGVGANFTISSSGGTYSIDSINNLGINYQLGDLITILGSELGGFDGINDVILTVNGVNTFNGITSVSLSGTAVNGTESYSQVSTTASTSNGSGDSWNISYENNVYNININTGGINYQAGDTIIIEGDTIYVDNTQTIVGGDVNNVIVYITEVDNTGAVVNYTTSGPTAGSTPVAPSTQNVYANPTYSVSSGSSGSGLVIQNVSTSGSSYSDITIDTTSLGTGFTQGDTITILGSQLGGLDITHNLTINITGIDVNGGVTSYSLSGTALDTNTQSSITTTNVTGTGTGATFDISVVNNEYNIDINGLGTGYFLGDTIVIPGGIDVVGGSANDITIQVSGVDATGGITSYTVQGTPYTGAGTFDASEGVYAVQDLQSAIGKQVFFN